MSAVHLDWHLATWAKGLAGSRLPETLLADPRLQSRLVGIAAEDRDPAVLQNMPDDVGIVLGWFNREAPAAVFRQLGILRHAAAWSEMLVTNRGKGVPDWIGLDEIKRALTLLQGLPEAAVLRSPDQPGGPEAVALLGQGMVAGWWATLDPALAVTGPLACAAAFSVNLPEPGLPTEVCAHAVLAAARSGIGTLIPADGATEPHEAASEVFFDD